MDGSKGALQRKRDKAETKARLQTFISVKQEEYDKERTSVLEGGALKESKDRLEMNSIRKTSPVILLSSHQQEAHI